MAATADSLQREVEALQACCPVLCPAIVPKGYDTQDLVALMQNVGRDSVNAFEQVLGQAADKASACCVCGADGSATSSSSASDEEDEAGPTLFFTLVTGLDFKNRSVVLQRAGFACAQCRALRSTCRMIRFAALRVGSRDGGSGGPQDDDDDDDSQQRMLVLAAHLAAVNGAPAAVQASPEALAVWLQELYCRAYALQVVASNLSGWRAVGPHGQALNLGQGKGVVAAAKLLLQGHQHGPEQKGKAGKKQKKKKRGLEAPPQQALQAGGSVKCVAVSEPVEARGKKVKKKLAVEDEAAGARQEVEPERAPVEPHLEQRAAKKQKKASAGSAGGLAAAGGSDGSDAVARPAGGAGERSKVFANGVVKKAAAATPQPPPAAVAPPPQQSKKKSKRATASEPESAKPDGGNDDEEEDGEAGGHCAAAPRKTNDSSGVRRKRPAAAAAPNAAVKKRGANGAVSEAGQQRDGGGKATAAPVAAGGKLGKTAAGGGTKPAPEVVAGPGARQVKKPKLAKK